ncbi:hypothetical protein JZU69_02400, partial [bacterium]|nr:hypothetical protein [bacterium]
GGRPAIAPEGPGNRYRRRIINTPVADQPGKTGLRTTMKYAVPTALGFDESGPLVTWRAGDGGRFSESFHEDTLRRYRREGGAEATTSLEAL